MSEAAQPALHELDTVLCAPAVVLGQRDGQIVADGAQGLFRHDRRVLSRLRVGFEGARLVGVGRWVAASAACYHAVVFPDGGRPDPRLRLVRRRELGEAGMTESLVVHNDSVEPVRLAMTVGVGVDGAGTDAVKAGRPPSAIVPDVSVRAARWDGSGFRVVVTPSVPADEVCTGADGPEWTWPMTVPGAGSWELELVVHDEHTAGCGEFVPRRPDDPARLVTLGRGEPDADAARLVERCESDLRGLLLADPLHEDAAFLAAGSPWYFTLFGRDSLWAARFLLPSGVELAGATLRALAARQGTRFDPVTEEQPGRIPHEVRRAGVDTGGMGHAQVRIPPLYYGTVDATPLWVCLLYEAWCAGLPAERVEALLPTLRDALDWMAGPADADGDGLLEYGGSDGDGLVNQGWKDSADGIRWDDGTIAERPLALCEVQGYAHAAAVGGARLLDAFGGDGGPWRDWARRLRERFRAAMWVTDRHGTYPAVAVDGAGRAVTGPASNMAHLAGTGLLDEAEVALVAARLAAPDLDSGYGLRTLSSRVGGFDPVSYHCGSVWPHDTAVAVLGLAAEGQHAVARQLGQGLVRAAARFEWRVPELYGGSSRGAGDPVTAYPAACSPQAWSAAGAAAVVRYLSGEWRG